MKIQLQSCQSAAFPLNASGLPPLPVNVSSIITKGQVRTNIVNRAINERSATMRKPRFRTQLNKPAISRAAERSQPALAAASGQREVEPNDVLAKR